MRLVVDLDPDLGANVPTATPTRLGEVVWNLLTNAVRHTPRDGRITVTGERSASGIRVRVKDTGAGIPAEHLPFVFERFRQIDSSTDSQSRRPRPRPLDRAQPSSKPTAACVEAASGGEACGATFTVTLPIRALDPAPASEEAPAGGAGNGDGVRGTPSSRPTLLHEVRVLVVDDDDSDSLQMVAEALRSMGAQVTAAKCAHDALGAGGPFDVIVSDIGMPGMDGYVHPEHALA